MISLNDILREDEPVPSSLNQQARRVVSHYDSRQKSDHVGIGGVDDPLLQVYTPAESFSIPNDVNRQDIPRDRSYYIAEANSSFSAPVKRHDFAAANHMMDYDPNPSAGAMGNRHQPDRFVPTTAFYERYLRNTSSSARNVTKNIQLDMSELPGAMRRGRTLPISGSELRAVALQQSTTNSDLNVIQGRGVLTPVDAAIAKGSVMYANDMQSRKYLHHSKPLFSPALADQMGITDVYAQGKTQLQHRRAMPSTNTLASQQGVNDQDRAALRSSVSSLINTQDDSQYDTAAVCSDYGEDGLGTAMCPVGYGKRSGVTEGLQTGGRVQIYMPSRMPRNPASWQLMYGPRRASDTSSWVYDDVIRAGVGDGFLTGPIRAALPRSQLGDTSAGTPHAHNSSRGWQHGEQTTGAHHDGSGLSADLAEMHNHRQQTTDDDYMFQRPLLGEQSGLHKKHDGMGALAGAVFTASSSKQDAHYVHPVIFAS